MSHPTPWKVEHDSRYDDWDDRASPYIVDANGDYVVRPPQNVGHPGAFDAVAAETAERIVRAVNDHDELARLRTALAFYANRDNWRSCNETLDLRLLEPEYVPASMTGQRISGIMNGWDVAEHALSKNKE